MTRFLASVCTVSALLAFENDAQAQHYHRHHHHHVGSGYGMPIARDGAGHLVDSRGHHVDQFGRHTGGIGVYANGMYSPSGYGSAQINSGPTGYVGAGAWNPGVASPNVLAVPLNTLPANVVPGVASAAFGKISIVNPADSGGAVNYVLNGNSYSIQPGQTQSLDNDRIWTIDFASGGPRGGVRYTLSPGLFKFVVKESGWELVRSAVQAAPTGQLSQGQIPPAPLPNLDAIPSAPAPAPFNPPPN